MNTRFMQIPVDSVLPNPEQPRKQFDNAEIEILAASIKDHGLIMPIKVEECDGSYILIDGERRLRAVKLLGLHAIDANVRAQATSGKDRLFQALIANMQRADLNVIEEARAYQKLRGFGLTLNAIARLSGRSLPHIELRLKLLELDPQIINLYSARKLPIEYNLVAKLARLPAKQAVVLCKRWAANGTGIAAINRSLTKILSCPAAPDDIPLSRGNRSPVIVLSGAFETAPGSFILTRLAADGSLPSYALIQQSADETCQACDLHDIATTQLCCDCPAVDLLRRLHALIQQQTEKN